MNNLDIIKIREELGVSHREFAELLGIDRRTVVNYEQGKLIPESKIRLIELLLQAKRSQSSPSISIENNCKEQTENLNREILELKDHIITLKKFLEEKTMVSEFLKAENARLKEEIETLKKD